MTRLFFADQAASLAGAVVAQHAVRMRRLTQQRLRQRARERFFAHAARTAEEISVRDSLFRQPRKEPLGPFAANDVEAQTAQRRNHTSNADSAAIAASRTASGDR